MNERIKELAQQYACHTETMTGVETEYILDADDLQDLIDAVRQDEREACARLCDDISEGLVGDDVDGAWGAGHCARAIEARGEK